MTETQKLTYGSLFSGIGGFDLGFERAGMECAWQCEIDKSCQEVLQRHFNVEVFNDVRTIGKDAGAVDLICGGFPCQDLSIAGKRAGLAGERSGLWFEFHRVLAELAPRWVVIENVPGLLSSNGGRDFAVILRGLGELGYLSAWRILDAQFFGIPQRRRRVFIVASLGSGRAAQVLFESEGMSGDIAPGREAGKDVAYSLRSNPSHSGDKGDGGINTTLLSFMPRKTNMDVYEDVSPTMHPGNGGFQSPAIAMSLTSKNQRNDMETETLVAYNIMPQNSGRDYKAKETNISQNLTTNGNHSGDQGGTYVLNLANSGANRNNVKETDTADTVDTWATQAVAYGIYDETTPKISEDVMPTLRNRENGGGFQQAVGGLFGVRRLTPTECARLQGFPDDWNDWLSDTVRYRQFGNAVAVPVAEWIGRQLLAVIGTLEES